MLADKKIRLKKRFAGATLLLCAMFTPLSPQFVFVKESEHTKTTTQTVLSNIANVSAGYSHTCALTSAGGVKCWGDNFYAQLGDGTTTNRLLPVDVSGLTTGVTSVSAGYYHTCALTSIGGVKCWGYNINGQLGIGTTTSRLFPANVTGLNNGVIGVSAGENHTCAVTSSGGVKCWGDNSYAQLGDGTTTTRLIPVDVMGLTSEVIAVSVGYIHTCALTSSGGVKCWGNNNAGQLGDGTTTTRLQPVDVAGLSSGVIAISTGDYHTCALILSGGVKCWGSNNTGQLGDGTTTTSLHPVDVVGLSSGVISVSTGYDHTCALTLAGGVKCWGGNSYAQLGDGTTTSRLISVDVMDLTSGVIAVSTGDYHTCAVTPSSGVKCWGNNNAGQLGYGYTIDVVQPIDFFWLSNDINSISVGPEHACVLTSAGGVKCWGSNSNGQLGNSSTSFQKPVDVVGLTSGATAISAGYYHTCALTSVGGVKCWGQDFYGQLGDGFEYWGFDRSVPDEVIGLSSGIVAISAGYYHTCALTIAGGVKCWGDNEYGQLGDGTLTNRLQPVDVVGLSSGVIAISASFSHTCALLTTGIKCWGANWSGQLGDGTTIQRLQPVDVVGLTSGVTAIDHTCALTSLGGVKCWGADWSGQLGDGMTIQRLQPVDVVGLTSGVMAISAGDPTCAVTSMGGVKCWGINNHGQLGDGTFTNQLYPVDVIGQSGNISAISTRGGRACALTSSGGVICWGMMVGPGYPGSPIPLDVIDAFSTITPTPTPTPNYTQDTLPPPLPRGCIGGGTPINYNNDTCCVKGFVYVDGIPVSGATVAVNYNGQVVTGTTAVSSDSSQPYFVFSLNEAPLYVPVNGSFTITATYGGQSKSVSVTALAGSQQVDIALVGNSSQSIATINKITPLDAKQGAESISFYGSGMDPDATNVISQYEWKIVNATTGFSVTNNAANFVISASSLTDVGTYTVTFRVQDDEGVWSGVVKQSLLVRNPQGGLTSGNTWTILIYADGDNNLGGSLGDAPGGMVRKLINLGSMPNVNVFGWYDGPKIGDSFEFQKYASGWFQKTALGEKRMDERATLLNFITAGMNAFPSDHVMLILADHANGIVGIAQDLSSDGTGRAFITPIELRTAVQQATQDGTRKLDVVVFDGCSFGQFEDIATMDGLADYVVASPNTGWGVFPYDVYRSLAGQSPAPAILAQQIAQTYATKVASYQSLPYTIAAYDLSRFNQAKEAIGSLGNTLISYVNADPATRRGQVSALRGQAQKYDSFSGTYYAPDSEDNYVDIVDFAQLVAQNIADGDVVSAATTVSNVLSGGSQPLIIYKDDRSGIVSSWNSGYAGIGTIPVVFQRYDGLGVFYPPRTSGDPSSAYYNYITNQLFHITWNWGWTNFIANGIPPSLGGNEPPAMPGDLLISPLTPCGDVFEPNDLPGAASTIMVDEPITNLAFCQVGDEDWYVFTATAGTKYAIETNDLTQDTDTLLSLYNGAGAMLVSDDNGNSAVSLGGSRITMTLGSGSYYIKANHVDVNAGNPSLAYSLKVTMIQPPKQTFVPSTMRASSTGW